MKGIELFYEEAKKRDYTIGETDVSSGETNGDFLLSNSFGVSTKQNYKKIADLYGTLTFYHFEPEEAIKEIFEVIDHSLKFNNNG